MTKTLVRTKYGMRVLAVVLFVVLLCSSVAPAAETVSQAQAENGTEQDWPPETASYDDPVIDYDQIDLQLNLTSANDSTIDYELHVLGAAEATTEIANDTVSCTDQHCLIDGEVGPNETAGYNLSGLVLDVEPADNVTTAVNGTLEGDALVGLGLGAINETRSNESDEIEGSPDNEDVFGGAVPDETAFRDDLDESSETRGTETDDPSYLVTFVTTADANRSNYIFTADGDVGPYQGDDYESPSGNAIRSVSNYDIDENGDEAIVTGHTANGFGDAYYVTGAITDVTLDNEDAMWIEVNGTPVTPEELRAVTAGDLALADAEGPPGLPPEPTGASIEVAELNVANVPPEEEYIVLENVDDSEIDLSGWSVRDREDDGRVANGWDPFEFPDGFTLDAGERVTIWSGEGDNTSTDLYWGYEANIWNQTGDVVIVENQDGDRVLEYEYGDRRPSENVNVTYEECTATVHGDGDGYGVEVETEYYSPDGHQTGENEREDVSLPVEVPSQNRILPARPPIVTTVIATSVTVYDEDEAVTEAENPTPGDCRAQIEEEWQEYRNGSREPIEDPEEISDSVVVADMTIETDEPEDERIVLENTADRPVDLSGWTVRDRDDGGLVDEGVLEPFEFPDDFTLDGGERVTIWTGDGSDSESDLYWGVERHIWNDDGDTIIVRSPDGDVSIEEPYRGGAPDGGDGADDQETGSDLSITYEDCSTVSMDGGSDDVDYEYEIGTTFYIEDGIDTMIFEPDDQPPSTFDADEQETGAVTDVMVDSVTVINADTGEEVTHRTNPNDGACSDTIAQQYDDWQDEESDESDEESTDVEPEDEEDAPDTDPEDDDTDGEDANNDAEGESDEDSDDGAESNDGEDGDAESDGDESEEDSDSGENGDSGEDSDSNEDDDEDSGSDENDSNTDGGGSDEESNSDDENSGDDDSVDTENDETDDSEPEDSNSTADDGDGE